MWNGANNFNVVLQGSEKWNKILEAINKHQISILDAECD